MSIGTEIIQDAASEIGVHSVVDPITVEGLNSGFRKLNSMLQLWQSQGIIFNFVPLQVVGDDLFEPPDTYNAIISNLAILMAPTNEDGKPLVGADLKNNARSNYEWVKVLYEQITIPDKVASSLLPRGQGNSKGVFRKVFNGVGGTVGN